MSVSGVSIGSGTTPRAYQPVATVDPLTGAAVTSAAANADGSQDIGGADGVTRATFANPVPVKAAPYTSLGYQQIANATLASSTALTVPGGATVALVQNNGSQPVRFRPDGATTPPTASTGQRIPAGQTLTFDAGNAGLTALRFIREADGVTLDISYYS